ncbi:MAG TPA: hypothetical protein VFH24_06350 [Gemmatimonadales bacterium]|nr:hypothetical protein [Gemmatimonadales bacterium]
MARNAFALALLTAIALGGCSTIKGALQGDKEEKAAQAKLVALRARTDSLRKARRLADSLAQVRFTACADSVRLDMSKPAAAIKGKKKRKAKFVKPSEELIVTRVQSVCAEPGAVPQTTIATADTAQPAVTAAAQADSAKAPAAVAVQPPPAPVQPAAAPATPTVSTTPPLVQDSAASDSVQKGNEMDMSRETFAYSGAARDPFNSLLNMAKTGPELADLQLVGIYQNLRAPSASIAVFREKDGGKRHKLRAGDQVGRSRLIQIRDRDVVFMIEDFGFERQETLSLRKQEDVTP